MKSILTSLRSTLLWFLLFYALFYFVFGGGQTAEKAAPEYLLNPVADSYVTGELVAWKLHEGDAPDPCTTNYTLNRRMAGQEVNVLEGTNCQDIAVEGGGIALPNLQSKYLSEPGKYTLMAGEVESAPVEISNPGVIRRMFRAVISRPLFNLLALLTDVLPGHSFGWAIVIMTLLVRLALFLPNQSALASQRRMQAIQPKLQEIQKRYKDQPQELGKKMMALYKQEKVNPMSSILPVLLQMPFLLGTYYIVQDGLAEHLRFFLYDALQYIDFNVINQGFFGLNLTLENWFPLPFMVAGAQFLAMKLGMPSAPTKPGEKAGQAAQMQKMMTYGMPAMIGFFTAVLPAGVGIYWLTSTSFGALQQWFLRRNDSVPMAKPKV